jgi:hypothetical protein
MRNDVPPVEGGRQMSDAASSSVGSQSTKGFVRRGLLIASVLALLASCTGSSASGDSASTSTSSSTPTPSNGVLRPGALDTHPFEFGTERFRVPPEATPYAYTTPTPPPGPTPVDGTYLRILTLDDMDGLLPFRCLRCPPYFPNAGVSTLILHRGSYWLNHQLSGFRALGMYTVHGGRIRFFNDPWCPRDHGVYRWNDSGGELTFEAISGTCDYEKARANDLSMTSWDRIKPCIFRIEYLWPGPVAC